MNPPTGEDKRTLGHLLPLALGLLVSIPTPAAAYYLPRRSPSTVLTPTMLLLLALLAVVIVSVKYYRRNREKAGRHQKDRTE